MAIRSANHPFHVAINQLDALPAGATLLGINYRRVGAKVRLCVHYLLNGQPDTLAIAIDENHS